MQVLIQTHQTHLNRFLPCMVAGLSYYLSFFKAADRTQMLKLAYEDEMKRALDERWF
jgi:hypothetical protein